MKHVRQGARTTVTDEEQLDQVVVRRALGGGHFVVLPLTLIFQASC